MAKGKGRQKIDIQRIENDATRQVTFSKRRGGVFKKSSELSTLCGAEAAVVIFSPSNKAHSFGSPSVVAVTGRFQRQVALGITEANQSPSVHDNPIVRQRNQDLTALERYLELEKQRKKELNMLKRAHQPNLDELTFEQLNDLREFVRNFKQAFETKLNDAGDNKNDAGAEGHEGGLPATGPVGEPIKDPNNQGQLDSNVDGPFKNVQKCDTNDDGDDKNDGGSEKKPGAEGHEGGLPATGSVGEPIKDPNNQGQPDSNVDDPFRDNEKLFGGKPLSSPGGPSHFPASLFDMGSFSSTNPLFPDPNVTFLAGEEPTDNPLDPTGDNVEYPYPDPKEAGSSKLAFPYNYGCPPDFVPVDDGTSDDGKD